MHPRLNLRSDSHRLASGDVEPCNVHHGVLHEEVPIFVDGVTLEAELFVPRAATGLVLFANGSGSSRHNPRDQFVAWNLHCAGLGTLLVDLLTREEEVDDTLDGHLRFNVSMLTRRLVAATIWSATHDGTRNLPVGYFGASTGAAAALTAASRLGGVIAAIVAQGGRLDLAVAALSRVVSPTLFIVGGADERGLELYRKAGVQLTCAKRLAVVPNATPLFEEQGALNAVGALASEWFQRHLTPSDVPRRVPVA